MDICYDFEKPIAVLEKKLTDLKELSKTEGMDFTTEISALQRKLETMVDELYSKLSPWQRVQLSRHPNRPYAQDYIQAIFTDFFEIHGDRAFGDDPAMITGIAKFNDGPLSTSVAIIAQQKGRNTKQKIERNFGMVRPEGYRKAIRVMQMAAQFGMPIITFIDTPGAYPGIDAEERGQSEAIARSIMEMFDFKAPIICTVIGEGGSGGALAIGIGDRVLMQEFSTYSVISPESCASILWSDSTMNEKAAEIMKMNAQDLLSLEVIDGIVREPKGGAHRDFAEASTLLKQSLSKHLNELLKLNTEKLITARKEKFRKIGLGGLTEGTK